MSKCQRCLIGDVTRGHGAKYCEKCRADDPHRHRARAKQQIIVMVDSEGVDGHIISLSYGREDGTSGSIWTTDSRKALLWLIDELSGEWDGKKQYLGSFHFDFDRAVLPKSFDESAMFLINKAGARNPSMICGQQHKGCPRMHKHDTALVSDIITEGGEGDVLAFDPDSGLAFAGTPKRRLYVEHRPNAERYDGWRAVDIHDNGSAFSGGLEDVIDAWQPELTEQQRAIIAWGKKTRKDGFVEGTPDQVCEYSEAECVAAARVVRKLLDAIGAMGIPMKPSQLYGSGSVATIAFKHHQVPRRDESHPSHKDILPKITPDNMATLCYFGGMIETPVIGLVKGCTDEEDINSAYPSVMIHLPCMRAGHGEWAAAKGPKAAEHAGKDTVGYVLCSWAVTTTSTPPFVVRTRYGEVRQPLSGVRIWVTMAEYVMAMEKFSSDIMVHAAAWWEQSCDCENPLGWLAVLYDQRLGIKAEMKTLEKGSPAWWVLECKQMAIKLIINSCYGKLAQQRPTLGVYTNMHYASHITGSTRAKVRQRTWYQESQGGTVVYQHTDSTLSNGGKPEDEGPGLGKWGLEKQSRDLLIVQPGLVTALGGGKTASRGCKDEPFKEAAAQWAQTEDLTRHPMEWDSFTVKGRRMISRRLAMARGKPELAGQFVEWDLNVRVTGGKRALEDARPMPGQDTAWIVPPLDLVENPARLEDIKIHQTALAKRIAQGAYDYGEAA